MKNFSIPPFNIVEIGQEVKRIGERLNIECNLACSPKFKEMGAYSLPTLSEDIVRIASVYGIPMNETNDLGQTGHQLQTLINKLIELGVKID